MTTILVPTDLSPAAQNATNYAANLCKAVGAKMILLHVYMLPVPISEIPYVMISADEIQKASETALRKEANRIFESLGIEIEWIVRLGLASDEIRDMESETNIDLVVMGMKGVGELDKLIGSTTVAVIRKCHKAVLVIPRQAKFVPFKLIAYATDFSYTANIACFEPLKMFIRSFTSELVVVNVQKGGKNIKNEQFAGKERLDQVLKEIPHNYQIIEDDDIEHGLHQFIETRSPDVLVMVAHKHNMIERLFGTHHTKAMIYQTHIPTLILQDKN